MDLFAAEIGLDRAEIRRRNFLPSDGVPHRRERPVQARGTGSELAIDSGDYGPARRSAVRWRATPTSTPAKEEALARGRRLGLACSSYIEACGVAPSSV